MSDTIRTQSLDHGIVEVVLHRPERRNALSLGMMEELTEALRKIGDSRARGIILGASGRVFCAGHDFADMVGKDYLAMRQLLWTCTQLMLTIRRLPQPVVASVQGLATGAGCQLALTCDLVVASREAAFETPGGRGGWFCTTPMIALTRALGPKRALEMLLTGDPVDATTAHAWGLINRVVPPEELDREAAALVVRATRGSAASKAIGKRAFYEQVALDERQAYDLAVEIMAASATTKPAQEGMTAFIEKRPPNFD